MQKSTRLSDVAEQCAHDWSLQFSESREYRSNSLIQPAIRAGGERLVLKIGLCAPEALHEAHALRIWNGNGSVRLFESWSDEDVYALLLERCEPGVQLWERLPEEERDVVIAQLLRRLWVAPPLNHGLRSLNEMCEVWALESEQRAVEKVAVDAALFQEGVATWREMAGVREGAVLLATDLHAGNVLAAEREPWLAIDPKPYIGDPAYDVLQHMTNCPLRLAKNPKSLCDRMADLSAISRTRVRAWMFARLIVDVEWPFGTKKSPTNYDVARRLAS